MHLRPLSTCRFATFRRASFVLFYCLVALKVVFINFHTFCEMFANFPDTKFQNPKVADTR